MWTSIYYQVLPVLGTFLVGVIGWWVTNWIARPIVGFEQTRRLTREELNFWKHLSKDWKPEKIVQGEDALRRLSARIEAEAASAGLAHLYFKFWQYDLVTAHLNLSGLANVRGTSRDERLLMYHKVEVALRLPTSEDPDRIKRINNRVESG